MRDAKGNDDCFLELCGVAPTKDNNCKSFNWQSAERSELLGPEPKHPTPSKTRKHRLCPQAEASTPKWRIHRMWKHCQPASYKTASSFFPLRVVVSCRPSASPALPPKLFEDLGDTLGQMFSAYSLALLLQLVDILLSENSRQRLTLV